MMRARVGTAGILTLGELVNKGSRFVLVVVLARSFGAADYGVWVLAAACGMILTSGGDLGLSTVVTRRIAQAPENASSYIAGLLAVVPLLVLLAVVALSGMHVLALGDSRLLLALGMAGAFDSATFLLLAPLRGIGRAVPEAAVRAAQGSLTLAGCCALLASGAGLATVAWALPFCSALTLATACVLLLHTFGAIRPRLDARILRDLLRESLPVAAAAVTVLVYFRIDAFLIAWLRGERATGVYGAAYSVAFGLTFVPAMFQRAHLPQFAAASPDDLRRAVWRRLRTSAAVAGISTVLLLVLTPLVVRLYGHEFSRMWEPYAILACAQAVFFLNNVLYTALLARGRTGAVWGLSTVRLGANIAGNLALIPLLGVAGAAIAAVLAELLLLGMQAMLVRTLLAPPGERTSPETNVVRHRRQPAL